MPRTISLIRDAQEVVTLDGQGDVFTLKITTRDANLLPVEIFGHQNRLLNPKTGHADPEFRFVCSPFDLVMYPANSPDSTQEKQFFRRQIIDVLVPSQTMAEALWQNINEDVEYLLDELARLDLLLAGESVRIGDPLEDETSSSESSSESTSESESESESGSVSS